jgi:hypothetical protein
MRHGQGEPYRAQAKSLTLLSDPRSAEQFAQGRAGREWSGPPGEPEPGGGRFTDRQRRDPGDGSGSLMREQF